MTTAFNMFVRQALNRGGIPFEVVRKDAFYSPYNQVKLRESIASTDKTVKSLDALEKLAQ
ncbi:MAG: type II toxin-antitoxin system antitoxin, RelB/DinJ family, partial [Clostridia bacterium]|nr:type II toxin-antitoxin system antitoxin, RelB/DinJ family [Clostridia bacterium]